MQIQKKMNIQWCGINYKCKILLSYIRVISVYTRQSLKNALKKEEFSTGKMIFILHVHE